MERALEMDEIQKLMRKYILTAICLVGLGLTVLGAQTIKAQRVWMDTTEYSHKASESIVNIINTYSPQLHVKMNKVVGYTTQTMYSYAPESPLSNMAADALLAIAKRHYGTDKVDFALTNFGGIRTFFPKGDLTLYYVYAAFPFENALVLVSLKGEHVLELFEHMALSRVEALAGVQLVIEEGKVKELLINGHPVDEKRTYHIATIDFLLGGGDRMTVLSKNTGTDYSGITLRDVMLQYITAFYEKGEPIPGKTDKRVVVIQKDNAS